MPKNSLWWTQEEFHKAINLIFTNQEGIAAVVIFATLILI